MTITRRACLTGLLLAGLAPACGRSMAAPAQASLRVLAPAPINGRVGHTALWTGAEMLIWGGTATGGAAYDPARDAWHRIADAPLSGRGGAAAVWTGQTMLVWGGSTGAAYDPVSDRWTPLPPTSLAGRTASAAAWTGTELLVWAGHADGTEKQAKGGAAYHPLNGTWRPIPAAPLPDFYEQAAVWSGQELLVFCGAFGKDQNALVGAAYNPSRDTWRTLAPSPVCRGWATAVWKDDRVLLLSTYPDLIDGGTIDPFPSPLAPVGAYIPATDTWSALRRAPGEPSPSTFVWTGEAGAFWNADPSGGLAYLADQDSWIRLPAHDGPLRESASAVWTGTEIIVWGGHHSYGPAADGPIRPLNDGIALRPAF